VPGLATDEGLRRQNARLVLHRGRLVLACIVVEWAIATFVGEASHGCVHVEVLRLRAAEQRRLRAMEEYFGLFTSSLFSFCVDQRAFTVIIDVFFDHLFLLILEEVITLVCLAVTVHHAM